MRHATAVRVRRGSMRVPAFQPAPDINLDELERRLRGEGAEQAGLDDPLTELVRLVESSRNSRSGTNVPGHAGTGGESTQPFDVATLSPSDESHDYPTETTAVDFEVPQANGVDDKPADRLHDRV